MLFDAGVQLRKAMAAQTRIQPKASFSESLQSIPQASEFPSKAQFPDHQAGRSRVEYDGVTPLSEFEAPSSDSSPSHRHHVSCDVIILFLTL